MVCLPVSGLKVRFRPPDGTDEIAFLEGDGAPAAAALRLVERIATLADGTTTEWARLPATDFHAALLHLRAMLVGPIIRSDVACPACRQRVDISFGVADYLSHIRPARPRDLAAGARDGWLRLAGLEFRPPTIGDLIAVANDPHPADALRSRCLPAAASARTRQRLERAVERLAPEVSGHVGGACPDCGEQVSAFFDVTAFVGAELRRQAASVYADVHLLAVAYGWDEAAILRLPGARRRRYAELIGAADRNLARA